METLITYDPLPLVLGGAHKISSQASNVIFEKPQSVINTYTNLKTVCNKCIVIGIVLLLGIHAAAQPRCKIEYYSTEQGLSHQRVTAMLKDKEGFMWFGSWDGINRFDGHSFVAFKSSPGDMSQLGNDRIDQIVEDQSGHLWIQSYDKQIYRFDKKTEHFVPLSTFIHFQGKSKVAFNKILAASNGFVWLQSVEDGIFCVPQNELGKRGYT